MRRRGLCLTPFAPQRIVAVARARRGFYRRPRAPPRRPSASSREAPELATRGAGLAARLLCGKGRAHPEEAVAAVRGSGGGDEQPEGGGARGARGRAREGCGARRRGVAASARRGVGPAILPRPVRPAENLRRAPPPLGALPGLRRRAGRDPSLQSGLGYCCPGRKKTPWPFRVISPECWLCLSSFSGGGLALGDASRPVLLGAGAKKIR